MKFEVFKAKSKNENYARCWPKCECFIYTYLKLGTQLKIAVSCY